MTSVPSAIGCAVLELRAAGPAGAGELRDREVVGGTEVHGEVLLTARRLGHDQRALGDRLCGLGVAGKARFLLVAEGGARAQVVGCGGWGKARFLLVAERVARAA